MPTDDENLPYPELTREQKRANATYRLRRTLAIKRSRDILERAYAETHPINYEEGDQG